MNAPSPGEHGSGRTIPALLLLVPLLVSCSPILSPKAAVKAAPAMIGAREIGRVVLVNNESRFVLLETQGGYPEPGTLLTIRRADSPDTPNASTSATARVGTERRGGFVVADIVSGEPMVRDAVFY